MMSTEIENVSVSSSDRKELLVLDRDKQAENHWCRMLDLISNGANHIISAGITVYTCWLAFNYEKFDLFELHIVLLILGYQFFMVESIVCLSVANLWTICFKPQIRRYIHLSFSCIALGLCLGGYVVIIRYKNVHFKSLHGILGLVSLVLFVPTLINGPITFVMQLLNRKTKPVFMKSFHVLTSMFSFVFGIACLCTGFQKRWFRKQTSQEVVTSFIVLSSITIILTLKTPILNLIKTIIGLIQSRQMR